MLPRSEPPARQRRRRGVVLAPVGLRKLRQAITRLEQEELDGWRYTLEALSERIGLTTRTIAKLMAGREGLDRRTIEHCFERLGLVLEPADYAHPPLEAAPNPSRQDWGEALDVAIFFGRTEELTKLGHWLTHDRCRVVAILGMGGMGKTALSVKLAQQVQGQFEWVIWRSLSNAPPIADILAEWLGRISGTGLELPTAVEAQIALLIEQLRRRRCLLVLDNCETILQSGSGEVLGTAGLCRPGFEAYGELFRRLGQIAHNSCLVLTSREKPEAVATLEGSSLPVRSLLLTGLPYGEAVAILKSKDIQAAPAEYARLVELYRGNPLALKIVATAIQDTFAGELRAFLEQETTVFNGIRTLLGEQFARTSQMEKELLYWLAIQREPVALSRLGAVIAERGASAKVPIVLESLCRRALVEKLIETEPLEVRYALQPVVLEYLTDRLIEVACREILERRFVTLHRHALMQAEAKDYLRTAQIQLIVEPVLEGLLTRLGTARAIADYLVDLIALFQSTPGFERGYAAGNLLNLLICLGSDLSGLDLSGLAVWQAYLNERRLHRVNFAGADLSGSTFARTFSLVVALAFHPDGQLLASGHSTGDIYLWQIDTGQQVACWNACPEAIWTLAFSPDGRTLVAGSGDAAIRFWDVQSGYCTRTLREHTGTVASLAFSPDGEYLASASADHSVRLWHRSTDYTTSCLLGKHDRPCFSLAFSPDGCTLISGGADHLLRVWEIASGLCLRVMAGHTDWLRMIAVHPAGGLLASCAIDHTVRL